MAKKNSDIFDKIEEDFKRRCVCLDRDNLFLFGNQVSLAPRDDLGTRDDLCSDNTVYEGEVFNFDSDGVF